MVKLSMDGGFTCPNRDGTKGYGGCIFCSERGSGDNASSVDEQIELLSAKWPNAGYIAYFQSFTNTYGPAKELREKYHAVLSDSRIEGLAIATRPDCLPEDVLELLAELREKTYLWVELGLQTIHEKTADFINRGNNLTEYDRATSRLKSLDIPFVTHMILGLPGEDSAMMHETLKYCCDSGARGLKFHLLNLVKNTRLAEIMPDYMPFDSPEEYISLVADLLEETPQEIVMHRLSADSPAKLLIAPKWCYRKRLIIDGIRAELVRRGTYQGYRSGVSLPSL